MCRAQAGQSSCPCTPVDSVALCLHARLQLSASQFLASATRAGTCGTECSPSSSLKRPTIVHSSEELQLEPMRRQLSAGTRAAGLEVHGPGIKPVSPAWKGSILPLNHPGKFPSSHLDTTTNRSGQLNKHGSQSILLKVLKRKEAGSQRSEVATQDPKVRSQWKPKEQTQGEGDLHMTEGRDVIQGTARIGASQDQNAIDPWFKA
ncbi:uncharacterized protein LOC143690526 [Tamandua tetradactyla]|uniref:uncharacterized protein LOC143690526 n=1 Tax=Tamandua tetradactyla TaxID=48850 RepID=UPI0040547CD0